MSEEAGLPEVENGVAVAEPVRLLIPSPIGNLGLELTGQTVTRLVIVPRGRERKLFTPFEEAKLGDFEIEVLGRFSEYFAGARRKLELGYDLGPSGVTGFSRRVLTETAKIPFGKTRSYQAVAAAAGNPEGYRQALAVLLANPLPILIPCHRVVTSRSGAGSYIAGTKKKSWLLRLERQVARRSSAGDALS